APFCHPDRRNLATAKLALISRINVAQPLRDHQASAKVNDCRSIGAFLRRLSEVSHMSARVAEAMRRRRLVLVVAAIGCALLIVLPLIGLWRINSKVEKSHDYVLLVSDVNDLASDLIRMTTLELAIYGTQPSDETEG